MHPSPSQSLVFTRDSVSWKFFVEASAVRERPKLIRRIIKNGGTVVNVARDADILLAENNTKEALEILEAWSRDKIVLSTRWVAKCLEANAFLGTNCGWAGCELNRETLRDGILQDDEDSEQDEEQDERPLQGPSRPAVAPVQKPRRSRKSEPGPSHTSTSSISPLAKAHSLPTSQPWHTSERSHTSPMSPLDSSQSRSTDPSVDSLPPISPQSSQTNLQQQALFSTVMNGLLQPLHQPPVSDYSQGQLSLQGLSQISPLFSPNFHQLLTQQLAFNPLLLPSQLRIAFDQSSVQGNADQQQAQPGILPSYRSQESSARPTPEDVDTDLLSEAASFRSEECEVELSITDKQHEGVGRAMSDSSHDDEIQTAVRSVPLRSRAILSRKGGLFTDNQGVPMKFFIMVDIKNRKDLLRIVRKHGGTIVSQMEAADYIILNNRSTQFQQVLQLLPAHSTALAPTWLEDCEETGKMAELAPHVIDMTSGVGRGAVRIKRIKNAQLHQKEDDNRESEENRDGPEQPGVTVPSTRRPIKTTSISQTLDTDKRGSRSRSPSPPKDVVLMSAGKHFFTEDDRIWFFRYARFKLERDPNMTHRALMEAMGRKAPHHSAKSWEISCRSKWVDEMNVLMGEISTLRRARNAAPTTPPAAASTSQLTSNPTPPHSPILDVPPSHQKTLNELLYPDVSSSPPQSWPVHHHPPPNTAPISSSSTQAIPSSQNTTPIGTLKRKDKPVDVDRSFKKVKAADVIDVDAYLEAQ